MRKIIVLLLAAAAAVSFTACKKDPEIPPEWAEETEKAANSPIKEVNRTTDFDGVWKSETTGDYYYFYNGHIFLMDNSDSGENEYYLWGTTVIIQSVEKEKAEEYETGNKKLEAGEEFAQHYNSQMVIPVEATTTVITENKVKTVTANGDEFVYTFVESVDDWPAGYDM